MNPMHAQRPHQIGKIKTCPKCKGWYSGYPAISRVDNKTEICPMCGQKEALEAFQGYLKNQTRQS